VSFYISEAWKNIFIVATLELLFLGFSFVFMGHGVTLFKRYRQFRHLFWVFVGIAVAVVSLYASYLMLEK